MRELTPVILVATGSLIMGMAFYGSGKGRCWYAFSMGAFLYGVAILGAIKGW